MFFFRCNDCGRSYPHSRLKNVHQCRELYCRRCEHYSIPTENHQCFIQPKCCPAPLDVNKIRFFDFEADPNPGGKHIPNFAAVWDGIAMDEKGQPDMTTYHDKGKSIIDMFVDGEFNEDHQGFTYVAHNAKGYDAQFIKESLSRRGIHYEYIPNGHKIMQLKIRGIGIRIIDSINFISGSLSKFPTIFGLGDDVRKGHYPYAFNVYSNWDYAGPMPPLQLFLPGGENGAAYRHGEEAQKITKVMAKTDDTLKRQKARNEIIRWHREKTSSNYVWNNFKELDAYCQNDVMLLAKGCLIFRDIFLNQTMVAEGKWVSKQGNPITRGVDPFTYMTIASACMSTLKHKFLERDDIAYLAQVVPAELKDSIRWLEFLMATDPRKPNIHHIRNGGQFPLPDGMVTTGYCESTKTAYQFFSCEIHGCKHCQDRDEMQMRRWGDSQAFLAKLRRWGFMVEDMWSCQFLDFKQMSVYRKFTTLNPVMWNEPLHIRHAFYGGRTNAAKLYHQCNDNERIDYDDFTSLYPDINKNGRYPIGHPKIIMDPSLEGLIHRRYFGVVKCRVVPPRKLLHPVLPVRHAGKLMFPLCRTCMQNECLDCTHSDAQRAFEGTWCTPEIYRAMDEKYDVVAVREVHHFKDTKIGLFENYVNTFLKTKQEASGWSKVTSFFNCHKELS